MNRIGRAQTFQQQSRLTLNTAESTTPEIEFEGYAAGMISIPSGSSITSLTWYSAAWASSSKSPAGVKADVATPTFLPMYTQANVAIVMTVAAGRTYPFPPEVYGVGALKILTNAAGAVDISLKG